MAMFEVSFPYSVNIQATAALGIAISKGLAPHNDFIPTFAYTKPFCFAFYIVIFSCYHGKTPILLSSQINRLRFLSLLYGRSRLPYRLRLSISSMCSSTNRRASIPKPPLINSPTSTMNPFTLSTPCLL